MVGITTPSTKLGNNLLSVEWSTLFTWVITAREIIAYERTSHPSNIKNLTSYKFGINLSQMYCTRLIMGLTK